MNPIDYIVFHEVNIKSDLENYFDCFELSDFINIATKIIQKINAEKISSTHSKKIIDTEFSKLTDIQISFLTLWLMKALRKDITYIHAYNYLVHKTNREEGGWPIHRINPDFSIAEDKIFEEINQGKIKLVQKAALTGFKSDLSEQQYKYLYKELTQSHQFIDDLKTDELDFINVFTKSFKEHDSSIYFLEETTQIAYIFYLLQKHFTNLFKCIGLSQKFISKDNNTITDNNISSQLSKTVKKSIPVKNNTIIEGIINNMPELQ